jgi:spore maturation protein CgeB
LFEDGSEILLFDKDDPEQLADHLRRLQAEPALGERIATNARRKLKRIHTVERRATQILDWTTSGILPNYAA